MPTITQKVDKKEYFSCNMYYLRKYLGIRELIVGLLLLGAGVALFVAYNNALFLILFAITFVLFLLAFALFIVTGKAGFRSDFERKGIVYQKFDFGENALIVTNIDAEGKTVFAETHDYKKLDKVKIMRDKVYIYAQVAVFYYICADSLGEIKTGEFADFLHERIPEQKFKIKSTYRVFKKRQKITKDTITGGSNKDKE